jgi:hypothetical protein
MAAIKFSFSLRGIAPGATETELADFFTAQLGANVVSIRMVSRGGCAVSWVEERESSPLTCRRARHRLQVPGDNSGPGGAYVNLSAGDPAKVLLLKPAMHEVHSPLLVLSVSRLTCPNLNNRCWQPVARNRLSTKGMHSASVSRCARRGSPQDCTGPTPSCVVWGGPRTHLLL